MKYYIGIDHYREYSYISVMDKNGKVVREGKIANTKKAIKQFLGKYSKNSSAALEARRDWTVMHDLLKENLHEVKLVNPIKIHAIARDNTMGLKTDAEILTDLLRRDLVPEVYAPDKDTRTIKNIVRQRMFLVKLSTMMKNRIYLITDRYLKIKEQVPFLDLFSKQGMEWLDLIELPKQDRRMLDVKLDLLRYINGKIAFFDRWIVQLAEKDLKVKLLMTIPGIGKLLALLISAEIGKISRFKDKNKLVSYAGLSPSAHGSTRRVYHLRRGNKYLKWAFLVAVWPAIRQDLSLKRYYESLKLRIGSNQAKIAVARRICIIVYRVLTQNRVYEVNCPGCPQLNVAEVTC